MSESKTPYVMDDVTREKLAKIAQRDDTPIEEVVAKYIEKLREFEEKNSS